MYGDWIQYPFLILKGLTHLSDYHPREEQNLIDGVAVSALMVLLLQSKGSQVYKV